MPETSSRSSVPEPSCQRCYQEMNKVGLRHATELSETEQMTVVNERPLIHQKNCQALPATQKHRIKDKQRRENGDLDEHATTYNDIAVGDEEMTNYSDEVELPPSVQ